MASVSKTSASKKVVVGVMIEKCSLDTAKCHTIGEVVYVPMPRHFTVKGKGKIEDPTTALFKFDTAQIPPVSFFYACAYKFGGIADAAADKLVATHDGKGTRRLATRADDRKRGEARYAKIMDGTYREGMTGSAKVAVSELLSECVSLVRRDLQKTDAWENTILRLFRDGVEGEEAVMKNLATAVCVAKAGAVPSEKRNAKMRTLIAAKAQENLDRVIDFDLSELDD